MSRTWVTLLTMIVFLALSRAAAPAGVLSCNDFDQCTDMDMCVDGECSGTPISGPTCDDDNECTGPDTCVTGVCLGAPLNGGTCDDGNECTTNDTCVSGVCQGTALTPGTACGISECGQCGDGVTTGICVPNPARQGMSCTDTIGACTENDVCLGIICLGQFRNCPDSDGDLCTRDFCNPLSGECENFGPTNCGSCQACDPESGLCEAANEGLACDDFNECSPSSACNEGDCVAGIPTGTATATVTFTPTGIAATPTETPTLESGTPTSTATGVPTGTATATATATLPVIVDTPTATPTGEVVDTPTGTPTGTVAATATATATSDGAATATTTASPTGTPTGTTAATATSTPTSPVVVNTPTVTNTVPVDATATATQAEETATATATRTATVTNTPLPVDATIIIGSANGSPGSETTISVSLDTSVDVAGTQNDITFDLEARIAADENDNPRCEVNPAINKNGTTFAFQPVGCTPGTDCTSVRALVLALNNVNPIPDGSVLYTCVIEIADDADGEYPLTCSNAGSGGPDGERIGTDCTDGTITTGIVEGATLIIGDAAGAAGDNVLFDVTLQTAVEVASTTNDIAFAPETRIAATDQDQPDCAANPALGKEASTFIFLPTGCSGTDCVAVRATISSATSQTAIPNGSVLYTCEIAIDAEAEDGTYELTCSNVSAQSPSGGTVPTGCVNGDVVVGVQPTATATGVVPTATETATGPAGTPTSTPTVGTPPPTGTATRTRPPTPRPSTEDDGCHVGSPAHSGAAWLLLIPAALLLHLRRRTR